MKVCFLDNIDKETRKDITSNPTEALTTEFGFDLLQQNLVSIYLGKLFNVHNEQSKMKYQPMNHLLRFIASIYLDPGLEPAIFIRPTSS